MGSNALDERLRRFTGLTAAQRALSRSIHPAEIAPLPVGLEEVTVGSIVLRPTDDLRAQVARARDMAMTAPGGPVVIHLPPGFPSAPVAPEPEDPDQPVDSGTATTAKPVEHVQLRRAANLVDSSQNVLIWVGGGAMRAGAGGAVAELAEKVGVPVASTALLICWLRSTKRPSFGSAMSVLN